jgi:hypothetical protein
VKPQKNNLNHQIYILDFHCVAKNIEGYFKICTLSLVYSRIWLNLAKDDRHFGYKQKLLKKKHWGSLNPSLISKTFED